MPVNLYITITKIMILLRDVSVKVSSSRKQTNLQAHMHYPRLMHGMGFLVSALQSWHSVGQATCLLTSAHVWWADCLKDPKPRACTQPLHRISSVLIVCNSRWRFFPKLPCILYVNLSLSMDSQCGRSEA